ncbi:MAG: hypothetical protein ACREJ6_12245, partial [Candidatus Methylomirabilis sp.]
VGRPASTTPAAEEAVDQAVEAIPLRNLKAEDIHTARILRDHRKPVNESGGGNGPEPQDCQPAPRIV